MAVCSSFKTSGRHPLFSVCVCVYLHVIAIIFYFITKGKCYHYQAFSLFKVMWSSTARKKISPLWWDSRKFYCFYGCPFAIFHNLLLFYSVSNNHNKPQTLTNGQTITRRQRKIKPVNETFFPKVREFVLRFSPVILNCLYQFLVYLSTQHKTGGAPKILA